MQQISQSNKTGTITITPNSVSISISKETKPIKTIEFVGIDTWLFYEFRRQLEYKSARYNGVTVIKSKPNRTSSRCSMCGAKIIPDENRRIRCQCGHAEDRDVNAARNILYKGVQVQLRGPWLRPDAPQDEAMKQSKDAKQIVVSQIYQP